MSQTPLETGLSHSLSPMEYLLDAINSGTLHAVGEALIQLENSYLDTENLRHDPDLLSTYNNLLQTVMFNNAAKLPKEAYDHLWQRAHTVSLLTQVFGPEKAEQMEPVLQRAEVSFYQAFGDAHLKEAMGLYTDILVGVTGLLPDDHSAQTVLNTRIHQIGSQLQMFIQATGGAKDISPAQMTQRPLNKRNLYGE